MCIDLCDSLWCALRIILKCIASDINIKWHFHKIFGTAECRWFNIRADGRSLTTKTVHDTRICNTQRDRSFSYQETNTLIPVITIVCARRLYMLILIVLSQVKHINNNNHSILVWLLWLPINYKWWTNLKSCIGMINNSLLICGLQSSRYVSLFHCHILCASHTL